MKRLIIIVLIFISGGIYAQKGQPEVNIEMMRKIEVARIAMITERLNLTPDQAEKFWPVYREFTDQRREILQNLREIKRQAEESGVDEQQSKALVHRAYELKQRELTLEKTYSDKMMKIISAQQLMSLRGAEEDFRRELLQRIEQRRDNQMRQEEMRDRREEYQKEKRGN